LCGYACIGCGNCGKKRTLPDSAITWICDRCGTVNTLEHRECRVCGKPLCLPPGTSAASLHPLAFD
jgi:hypothetical protein